MNSNAPLQRRFVVVSGLSGAGKSVVLNTLEDLGFYCIDNLPVSLLDALIGQLRDDAGGLPPQIGVGIDARNPQQVLRRLPETLKKIRREDVPLEIVFLEANADVLTKRFSETRRRHPLSSDVVALADAIDEERALLGPLCEMADLRIDTSQMALHELRDLVRERIARRPAMALSMQFVSFGYKHGTPRDSDFVFDVRCLPNPHWEKELRNLSGLEQPVIEFLMAEPDVMRMFDDIRVFLETWIPRFEADNRSYLCVAIGCTGGHHRSVFMVEQLARHFRASGKPILVKHRDL